MASLGLPFVWTTLQSWWLWALLCFMGAMAAIGHYLLILAYQRAPAATLTPYLYTQIGFAMLGGWMVFSHLPDRSSMAGIVTIAVCGAGGAWLTVRESRMALEPLEA
jgi:drug/metabolite transporter (DMT)-like permease